MSGENYKYMYNAVLEIIFESVQQKHQDKTIFDQQVVNFVWTSKSHKSVWYPFMSYEIYK